MISTMSCIHDSFIKLTGGTVNTTVKASLSNLSPYMATIKVGNVSMFKNEFCKLQMLKYKTNKDVKKSFVGQLTIEFSCIRKFSIASRWQFMEVTYSNQRYAYGCVVLVLIIILFCLYIKRFG